MSWSPWASAARSRWPRPPCSQWSTRSARRRFFGKAALFGRRRALLFVDGALTFVYLFQSYQHTYWRPSQDQQPAPRGVGAVVAAVAVVVLVVGLWPEPLLTLSDQAGAALTRMAS